MRPFGALVFGRIGDLVGRKYTFLVTILVMGVSTAAVGLLPTYATIGMLSPIMLVLLRLAQGLALGGEYGGAATYVAEHAPDDKRGLAHQLDPDDRDARLLPVAGRDRRLPRRAWPRRRSRPGAGASRSWSRWSCSSISVYIRLKLNESPVFLRMKAEGKGEQGPLRESFTNWSNLKIVLLALFGATAGQGVVWYTGQFYALFFLTGTLKIDWKTAYIDPRGRAGPGHRAVHLLRLAVRQDRPQEDHDGGLPAGGADYFPIYRAMTHFANPAWRRSRRRRRSR